MNNKKIELLLLKNLNLKKIYITGDNSHIKIVAAGDIFKGLSQVKRQQIVYKPLINIIKEKHIHAISIAAYTIQEWEKNNKTI